MQKYVHDLGRSNLIINTTLKFAVIQTPELERPIGYLSSYNVTLPSNMFKYWFFLYVMIVWIHQRPISISLVLELRV